MISVSLDVKAADGSASFNPRTAGLWRHIDIEIIRKESTVYINGEEKGKIYEAEDNVTIEEILGDAYIFRGG